MGGTFANWLIDGIVVVGVISMIVAIGIAWRHKASIGWMTANVVIWVVITGIFIAVYVYQTGSMAPAAAPTQEQAVATTTTPTAVELDNSSLRIVASDDGHYRVDGLVNGASVQFLVDTGASVVLLTPDDARRAGIDPDRLQYGQSID